jgi:single-stranded-DNA-specific exonuclease
MPGIPIPHLKWIEPDDSRAFDRAQWFNRLLAQRGLSDPSAAAAYMDPSLYLPASPFDLPGMHAAVDTVLDAVKRGERIGVWGDFDVDGQTSTTILVSTLKSLGTDVIFHIPVRADESHGVNLPNLEKMIADGAKLLLTCDTGVTAHVEVLAAHAAGLRVVITDHHALPEVLPDAEAVVNPRRLPETHPLGTLSGSGVAWKLAEALCSTAGQPAPVELLDLAALGLVADMAELRADARWMVQKGLAVLRENQRTGMQELLKMAEVNAGSLTEEHIGFQIAPRLNALGRLSDANSAVELFTTSDPQTAKLLANQLEGLNAQRKLLTDQVFQAVLEQLDRNPALLNYNALVLSNPAWPGGVVGIVAGRLAEIFQKPTILFSVPSPEKAGGSARSVPGVNIIEAISRQSALLKTYGGHPMAAGMSLRPDLIPDFRQALSYTIEEMTGGSLPEPALPIDLWCPLADLDLDLVQDLERLSPFGQGNPAPIFACREVKIEKVSPIGRTKEHLRVTVSDAEGKSYPLVWWQGAGLPLPPDKFDLAYKVRSSTFRGEGMSIEWVDARYQGADETAPYELNGGKHLPFTLVDCRKEPDPQAVLARFCNMEEVEVWAEGSHRPQGSYPRSELTPASALAVWSTPPSPAVLAAAIDQVKPKKIILFAQSAGTDDPQTFLRQLMAAVKGVIARYNGQISLEKLAGAVSQRESTVASGLKWLQAKGFIEIVEPEEGTCILSGGTGKADREAVESAEKALHRELEETAAYRRYFLTAAPEALFKA